MNANQLHSFMQASPIFLDRHERRHKMDGLVFLRSKSSDPETESRYSLQNDLLFITNLNLNSSASSLSWNITEDAAGYTAELVIPWSCIGLAEPALLGFDIAVDNTDRSGKRNQTVWAGGELNHKDRTYFGTLLKE